MKVIKQIKGTAFIQKRKKCKNKRAILISNSTSNSHQPEIKINKMINLTVSGTFLTNKEEFGGLE